MLGKAAVVIWCDVAAGAREEFDDWHAHEHLPERLAIPGFRRGSRWASVDDAGAYFMLYETESLDTTTSAAYLERLNNPTPWSRKMMPHHRNMARSLCRVDASHGAGLGGAMLTLRLSPSPEGSERLERWLATELLPSLPARKGVVAAHFLKAAAKTAQTTEQKIRGGDATADWVVLVNGYSAGQLAALAAADLNAEELVKRGAAAGPIARIYGLAASLM